MEQITIEGILDEPLIQLVKNAPTNPITRGQVRAATNLVIPDGVITTEGITQYVLENYDESKAPSKQPLRIRGVSNQPILFELSNVTATQTRYYRCLESCNAYLSSNVPFSGSDFEDCYNKEDIMNVIERKIYDDIEMNGSIDDEEHYDTVDRELEDTDNLDVEYDSEQIWLEHGESIQRHLGLDIE